MTRDDMKAGRPSGVARPGAAPVPKPVDRHREWVRQVLKCPDLDAARRLVRSQFPDETPEQIDQRIETARMSGERKVSMPFQPLGVPPETTAARKAARKVEVDKRRHLRRIEEVEKQLAAARRRSLRAPGRER